MKHLGILISLLLSITACSQEVKTVSKDSPYDEAFGVIKGMLTKDTLSFKKAVFLVKNAYLDGKIFPESFHLI